MLFSLPFFTSYNSLKVQVNNKLEIKVRNIGNFISKLMRKESNYNKRFSIFYNIFSI